MGLRLPVRDLLYRWSDARRASRLPVAAMICVIIVALAFNHVPWRPVPASAHRSMSLWDRRDSAEYVISTMNLVHCRDGRPLMAILVHRYPVTAFDVYADQRTDGLFFIEPKRGDGTTVGALAYQMGWTTPMSVSSSLRALHVSSAPADVYAAFRNDQKQLIGSFSSTVPS